MYACMYESLYVCICMHKARTTAGAAAAAAAAAVVAATAAATEERARTTILGRDQYSDMTSVKFCI